MEEETYVEIVNEKDKKFIKKDEIVHKYYKNKIDLDKVSLNKIEKEKLLNDNGYGHGTYYATAIKAILSKHGHNPEIWVDVDSIFDKEFPIFNSKLFKIWKKYEEIKEKNEILNKYKDVNEDFLTQEERETIEKIKDDINIKKSIETHNVLIDKMQRIEMNIDKLGPRAEKEYLAEHREQKNASIMSILATLLSIMYSAIATIFIYKYFEAGDVIASFFSGPGGIISIVFGVIIITIFILFFISAYIGCIHLMSKWSESIGMFALIAGVLGVVFGPVELLLAISRGHMELELGYSDPSQSYMQVSNEYEKVKAARNINRKR